MRSKAQMDSLASKLLLRRLNTRYSNADTSTVMPDRRNCKSQSCHKAILNGTSHNMYVEGSAPLGASEDWIESHEGWYITAQHDPLTAMQWDDDWLILWYAGTWAWVDACTRVCGSMFVRVYACMLARMRFVMRSTWCESVCCMLVRARRQFSSRSSLSIISMRGIERAADRVVCVDYGVDHVADDVVVNVVLVMSLSLFLLLFLLSRCDTDRISCT